MTTASEALTAAASAVEAAQAKVARLEATVAERKGAQAKQAALVARLACAYSEANADLAEGMSVDVADLRDPLTQARHEETDLSLTVSKLGERLSAAKRDLDACERQAAKVVRAVADRCERALADREEEAYRAFIAARVARLRATTAAGKMPPNSGLAPGGHLIADLARAANLDSDRKFHRRVGGPEFRLSASELATMVEELGLSEAAVTVPKIAAPKVPAVVSSPAADEEAPHYDPRLDSIPDMTEADYL